jgi:hypothetical protein
LLTTVIVKARFFGVGNPLRPGNPSVLLQSVLLAIEYDHESPASVGFGAKKGPFWLCAQPDPSGRENPLLASLTIPTDVFVPLPLASGGSGCMKHGGASFGWTISPKVTDIKTALNTLELKLIAAPQPAPTRTPGQMVISGPCGPWNRPW